MFVCLVGLVQGEHELEFSKVNSISGNLHTGYSNVEFNSPGFDS